MRLYINILSVTRPEVYTDFPSADSTIPCVTVPVETVGAESGVSSPVLTFLLYIDKVPPPSEVYAEVPSVDIIMKAGYDPTDAIVGVDNGVSAPVPVLRLYKYIVLVPALAVYTDFPSPEIATLQRSLPPAVTVDCRVNIPSVARL